MHKDICAFMVCHMKKTVQLDCENVCMNSYMEGRPFMGCTVNWLAP